MMVREIKLGLHLSIVGRIDKVVDRAMERGCDTLQMFSRNPRGWRSKELDSVEIENFRLKLKHSGIWPVFIHTPYLLNLASPKEAVYRKSVEALDDELHRAAKLGVPYVVTHLGSHLGYGKKEGFRRIIEAVNNSFSETENNIILLLENTAGTGTAWDPRLRTSDPSHPELKTGNVLVCALTHHMPSLQGTSLVSQRAVEHTMRRFDETIRLKKLKLVHLNDSKGGLGSKIDRHEHIGMGKIGEKGFRNILRS